MIPRAAALVLVTKPQDQVASVGKGETNEEGIDFPESVRRSEAARSTGRTSMSAAASEQTLKAREVNVCVVPLHVCLCEREEGGGVGESKRVSEGARGEGARARARGREGEREGSEIEAGGE